MPVMPAISFFEWPALPTGFLSYETWTSYNSHNQPLLIIYPEGNSRAFIYESGTVSYGGTTFFDNRRAGLLVSVTEYTGNPFSTLSPPYQIPALRSGPSSGQSQLTQKFFHDPIFNQQCAVIERRGNPIDASGDYFAPQNQSPASPPTHAQRYATFTLFDYQKNDLTTITTNLQSPLNLTAAQIGALIGFVGSQMTTAGLSTFSTGLGDINGDGTGAGASQAAAMIGNVVKVQHPTAYLVGAGSTPVTQYREEVFTTNNKGQTTTHTDENGNLEILVYYPYADPEGDGGLSAVVPLNLGGKQYGRLKERHVDANPNDVLSLLGSDADLVDFISPPSVSSNISRTNTPGMYQDLVTRYEGGSGASGSGCSSCAYDPMGNPLAVTSPRGFTTRFDRNELGEAYRTISPQPYNFRVETYFDANRNVVRVDTEDLQPAYDSSDPTSARFAQFTPSGSNNTAHVAMQPGPGGSVRPGWFTNLFTFDLLDNKIQDDIDATGSTPANLITNYVFDPNQNQIQITKPEGNIVEMDYDERNLKIATRVGRDAASGEAGAITVTPYDGNGNLLQVISPPTNGAAMGNLQTVTIEDAFRSGVPLTYMGVFALENIIDGFDRVIKATDAVGGYVDTGAGYTGSGSGETGPFLDPDGRVTRMDSYGTTGGATPSIRTPEHRSSWRQLWRVSTKAAGNMRTSGRSLSPPVAIQSPAARCRIPAEG
jgi:hypothetical protein